MSTETNKSQSQSLLSQLTGNNNVTNLRCYYDKRIGSSGIGGHLYETKLLSLILLRALYDDNTKDFILATNLRGVGALDDIILKYRRNDMQTSKLIFLQAKHRDNKNKLTVEDIMKPNGDFSLQIYLESYYNIKQSFLTENDNLIFQDSMRDIECEFIIYTSAEQYITYNKNSKEELLVEDSCAEESFIKTSKTGKVFKIRNIYNFPEYDVLASTITKSRIIMLAKAFSKFILVNNFKTMMVDDLMKTYHVFLAQKVVKTKTSSSLVDEILESHKIKDVPHNSYYLAEFQQSFLSSNDENLILLRDEIHKEIIKFKGLKSSYQQNEDNTMKSLTFKLPTIFGNHYFRFDGSETKQQNRLDHMCSIIQKLLPGSVQRDSNYIFVKLDDDAVGPDKILQRQDIKMCWLGGLVGNFLIHDDETKMLKFNLDEESLSPDNIKILHRLNDRYDLDKFRLNINIYGFPKLILDAKEHDRKLVSEFLCQLKFYTNQAKEDEVENILKHEIYRFLNIHQAQHDPFLRVKCDVIYLKVHDEIQKWWKQPRSAPFLTKECTFYEQAKRDILDSSLLHIANFICREKIKKTFIEFKDEAIDSLELECFLNSEIKIKILISQEITFSLIKVMQYFHKTQMNKNYVILDLECDIIENYFENINSELETTKVPTMVVVGRGNINFARLSNRINCTTKLFKGKILIIAHNGYKDDLDITYPKNILHKDVNFNLSSIGRKMIHEKLEKQKLTFQGELVTANNVLDDASLDLLSLKFLSKIVHDEKIVIGKPWVDNFFDRTVDFYVKRNLSRYNDKSQPETLKDIKEQVVIISAEPGMGKSTLLTHLAINTKRKYPRLWILKINLLDSSVLDQLSKWKASGADIDLVEAMRFLYSKIEIEENHEKVAELININDNYEINLIYNDDDNSLNIDLSEIKLFNYFYNNNHLAVLFEGFDEICPDYTNEVIQLITTLKSSRVAHLWVTSRPYNSIEQLESALVTSSFNLKPLTKFEQKQYLTNVWYHKYFIGNTLNPLIYFEEFCSLIAMDFDNDKNFMGIPLHLHMIAEIYQNDVRRYIEFQESKLSGINIKDFKEPRNLTTVYAKFTNKKFDIQFEEKNTSMNSKDPFIIALKERERKTFIENHKKMSAYLLLNKNILLPKNDIKKVRKFINRINLGKEKTGIVKGARGIYPKFIHNTFAVYFAVELIFDKLRFSCSITLWEYFINNILIGNNREFIIRKFIDSKLQNDKSIITRIKSNKEHRDVVFNILWGQFSKVSAIYMAIKEDFQYITTFLIECLKMSLKKNNLPDFIKLINSKCDRYCIYCAAALRCKKTVLNIFIKLITDICDKKTNVSQDSSKLNQLMTLNIPAEQICVSLNLLLQHDQRANDLLKGFLSMHEEYWQSTTHWTLGKHGFLITFCLDHLVKLNKEQRMKALSLPELENQFRDNIDFYRAMNKLLRKEDVNNIPSNVDGSSFRNISLLFKLVLEEAYPERDIDVENFITNVLPKLQLSEPVPNSALRFPSRLKLYVNKLLNLVLLRALCEDNIKEFILATQVTGTVFDDIILRYKNNDTQDMRITLINVLYKDNWSKLKLTIEDMLQMENNKDCFLDRCLQSYLEVKQRFDNKYETIFQGSMKTIECRFIVYTNAKLNFPKKEIKCSEENIFFQTSKNQNMYQLICANEDIDFLVSTIVKRRAVTLANILSMYIFHPSNFMVMMSNKLIKSYHSFLTSKVITVTTTDEFHKSYNYGLGKFKQSFLKSNEESLLHLKHEIYDRWALRSFTSFTHKDIIVQRNSAETYFLSSYLSIKLPVEFCKPIYEDEMGQEKRVDNFCFVLKKIFNLHYNKESKYIIVELDDESVGPDKDIQETDLVGNNSLSKLVGDLLINDDETELLKFNLQQENLSKENIQILQQFENSYDLSRYRFDINIRDFPKLTLNCKEYDRKLVRDFLSKLQFYTTQANLNEVVNILNKDIHNYFNVNKRHNDFLFRAKCDAIFFSNLKLCNEYPGIYKRNMYSTTAFNWALSCKNPPT